VLQRPGPDGAVPRHQSVEVAYLDEMARRRATLLGYVARVVQHELDHLAGTIFLDRMTSMRASRQWRLAPFPPAGSTGE